MISQVYGGGGNTGAQYTNDFIEIFNPTASADVSRRAGACSTRAHRHGHHLDEPDSTLTGSVARARLLPRAGGAPGAGTASRCRRPSATRRDRRWPRQPARWLSSTPPRALTSNFCSPARQQAWSYFVGLIGSGNANCSETAPAALPHELDRRAARQRRLLGHRSSTAPTSPPSRAGSTQQLLARRPHALSGCITLSINAVSTERWQRRHDDVHVHRQPLGGYRSRRRHLRHRDRRQQRRQPGDYTAKSLTGPDDLRPATRAPRSMSSSTAIRPSSRTRRSSSTSRNVTGATVADGQGQGTIVNDDAAVCGDPFTPIYTIQGSGAATPIPGIVTHRGRRRRRLRGHCRQTAASTSRIRPGRQHVDLRRDLRLHGQPPTRVSVGDRVRVTGFARERFSQTTLNGSNSDAPRCLRRTSSPAAPATASPQPTSRCRSPSATTPEQFEGMLVRLPQSLVDRRVLQLRPLR